MKKTVPIPKNLWKIMKITIYQFVLAVICGSMAFAHTTSAQEVLNRTISIVGEKVELKEILSQIEKKADVKFVYSTKIKSSQRLTLNLNNMKLSNVLDEILKPAFVEYEVIENRILLKSLKKQLSFQPNLIPIELNVEQVVKGMVSDENGVALPGVSVIIKGTQRGITTDNQGIYKLSIPDEQAILIFSYVGYISQEIKVGDRSTINIVLKPDNQSLEEVVVVGYGTVKKSDLTGAVSSVSKKDLGDRVTGSVATLLQGRVPGLDITGDQIRVRGVTTLNNTDPLFVIDGFLGGSLASVNANDIEHIEVLKDASATAIYGARGANGVILVTTKSGKIGGLKVSVNAMSGFQVHGKQLSVLNAQQYNDLIKDMLANAGQSSLLTNKLKSSDVLIDRTYWQDAVLRTGYYQEYNIDFSGGSDKSNYLIALGYRNNKPISIGSESNTITLRAKNQFNIRKWLKIGSNLGFVYRSDNGASPWSLLGTITYPPYLPVYDSNNVWGTTNVDRNQDLTDNYNPVNGAVQSDNHTKNLDFQTNLFAEIEPFKNLVYRMQLGVSGAITSSNGFTKDYVDGGAQVYKSNVTENASYRLNPLLENYITYSKELGKHNFSAMVGSTFQDNAQNRALGINGIGYTNYGVLNVYNAAVQNVTQHQIGQYAYFSYFGRLNYSFKDRYLLTANFRRDASPRFAPANRWATFPSVALGWKLHEEPFLKNQLGSINQLKLRTSWGISGNDAIGDFKYASQVWTNSYYAFGQNSDVLTQGATVFNNSSGNIKWESTESKNIGLDLSMFGNKLQFTAEYFDKITNDILFGVPRPISLGYGGNQGGGNAIVNAASVINNGIELSASYQGKLGGLSYNVSGYLTLVKNKVTSLGTGQPYLSGNISRTDIGNPIGYFYGYIADGIYRTKAEIDATNASAKEKGFPYFQEASTSAGDVRFRDLNGDGRITTDDRTNIGSPIPTQIYGSNINLGYKGFDLNIVLQGVGGNKLYYANYSDIRGMSKVLNAETYVLDRWRSETSQGNGIVPRAIFGDPSNNNRVSTLQIEDGAYLRLKQISLGYSVSREVLNKIKMSSVDNLRFYVSATNLLTFTKFTGFNPEVGGDNLSRGYSSISLPITRQIVFGTRFTF